MNEKLSKSYCLRGIWLMSEADNQIKIMKVPCKSWDCEHCGAVNTGRWKTRLQHAFRVLPGEWQFISFTAHENWRGMDASIENIRRNSDKLWKRWQRMAVKCYGKTFHYVRVYEPHSDGSLHVHAFIKADFRMYQYQNMRACRAENRPARKTPLKPRRWLKNNSRYCGMGYQTDVQKITDTGKATAYITKYISKNLNATEFPPGTRRIQTSAFFPAPAWWTHESGTQDWTPILEGIPTREVLQHLRAGKSLLFVNENREIKINEIDTYFNMWQPHDILNEAE